MDNLELLVQQLNRHINDFRESYLMVNKFHYSNAFDKIQLTLKQMQENNYITEKCLKELSEDIANDMCNFSLDAFKNQSSTLEIVENKIDEIRHIIDEHNNNTSDDTISFMCGLTSDDTDETTDVAIGKPYELINYILSSRVFKEYKNFVKYAVLDDDL